MAITPAERTKRWREGHPNQHREQVRKWRKEHPEEYRQWKQEYCRNNSLIINGKWTLVAKRPRPDDTCEVCNRITPRLEYHHWDDKHPCLGLWLCPGCHRMAERVDKDLHIKYIQERQDMVLVGRI